MLCLAASSSRYRGASSGFDFLLVSPSLAQTVGLADWIGLPNPHSSSRYLGVNPADKIPYLGVNPAHKIPPRVVIVVSTPPRVVIVVPTPWCNDSCRNSMRGAGQYALFLRS